jgi:hypothetical protein
MPRAPSTSIPALPRWLIILGSLAIVFHFFAVGVVVLAAPSGPWPSMEGPSMAGPPQFAQTLLTRNNFDPATRKIKPEKDPNLLGYLRLVRMPHHYHFSTNRPEQPGAYIEARLKDEAGQPITTLKFPDPNANFWVQHRQDILARALANDEPVQPPQSEIIAAPAQETRKVTIWEPAEGGGRSLKLKTVPEHLVPRDRPVERPAEWAVLLAQSYARYLCRSHGAASVEIIRHTQFPIPPSVLFMEPQAGAFDELASNFGEYSK